MLRKNDCSIINMIFTMHFTIILLQLQRHFKVASLRKSRFPQIFLANIDGMYQNEEVLYSFVCRKWRFLYKMQL